MKHFTLTVVMLVAVASSLFAQTTIYTQDFTSTTLPVGWTNVDNTGSNPTNGIWKRVTNTALASTTASTGFFWFLSDAQNNDNLHEDASLTSSAINCSSNSKVFLQMQQQFYTYYTNNTNSEGKVLVSNNGTTWNEVYSVTTSSASNPELTSIDLSAYAANQATVFIRFQFTGDWDGYWAIDDIKIIEPVALDVAVDAVSLEKYIAPSTQSISGTFSNQGNAPITSVQLSYSVNGGAAVNQNFFGFILEPFATRTFTFTTPANFNTVQTYSVVVSASSPNNGTDLIASNNTKSGESVVLSHFPIKNVLMEEFTTAPCQYCPDGSSRLNHILDNNTRLIGVALHAGFGTDAMTITDHSTLASSYTDFAPAMMIDRVYYDSEDGTNIGYYNDPNDRWEPYAQARKEVITPVSIAATNTYNSGTRALTVDMSATFYGVINDGFRVNCYILEDSVSGTGSGYNQSNASNATSTSEWYQAGNPIVGYKHRHVTRYMFGGAWGTAAVVPSTTADGVPYNKQYTYTLPVAWNDSRIKLVVLVQHYNAGDKFDRQILNAMELDLNSSDSTGLGAGPSALAEVGASPLNAANLYPNPTSDLLNVEYTLGATANFSIDVRNVVGQVVTSFPAANLAEGNYKTQINTADYSNGIYFVSLKDNGKSVQTLKFVVSK